MSATGDREELLTVEEVAAYLKLNQQTVRNMIDRGQLHAVRIGARRVRIRQSELDRFIAAGEPQTATTNEGEPRAAELTTALADALRASNGENPAELAAALRNLAATAERLADSLDQGG